MTEQDNILKSTEVCNLKAGDADYFLVPYSFSHLDGAGASDRRHNNAIGFRRGNF
jgi:hypothetical protein